MKGRIRVTIVGYYDVDTDEDGYDGCSLRQACIWDAENIGTNPRYAIDYVMDDTSVTYTVERKR